jgi:NSS family neurotransmitter:Na+ symporter
MAENKEIKKRSAFRSRFGIIAAAAGSAIGLGNIWRFPYMTGENGGAAFILIYLGIIFAIGVPLMISEFIIGRQSQRNPVGAFKVLKPNSQWKWVGVMGVIASLLILAFYSTVAGWTLEYIKIAVANQYHNLDAEGLRTLFSNFTNNSFMPVFWQVVFIVLTVLIVLAGVEKGIERYTKLLMPLLLLIIIVLCIRSVTLPGASKGLSFLFNPDFSKIDGGVVLNALGQAFFSLSLGMGTMITYGSYIKRSEKLPKIAVSVSITDTLIAILAGVAIFPAVFALGFTADEGTGLVFIVLPQVFNSLPAGQLFAITFFILLFILLYGFRFCKIPVFNNYVGEQFVE